MKEVHIVNPLQQQLAEARAETDRLFSMLTPEAIFERPVSQRHRLIFYLGHLEAFDWNHIAARGLSATRFQPEFDRLFEAGIDPDPMAKVPSDKATDWPQLKEVLDYRKRSRDRIDAMLAAADEFHVHMAIEHRLMHAETLAYLLHNLPYDQKRGPDSSRHAWKADSAALRSRVIEIPSGVATLGKSRNESFGWDNESEENSVEVPSFEVDRCKVTNGQYLEFVDEGAPAPFFWHRSGEQWHLRGMFGLRPLPLDWPVFVTQAEAVAYCRWKGKQLPSEAQFHRAAYATKKGVERQYPWGDEAPDRKHGNFGFHSWDLSPVDDYSAGDSSFGVSQLLGNGWEWTSSVFAPFPGFEPMPGYEGYSANFFDGKHYVLKGASPRTASCFLRRSFRNWFRPNYPYVYAGFRCIQV